MVERPASLRYVVIHPSFRQNDSFRLYSIGSSLQMKVDLV
jgi:hypothetical protein